MGAVEGGYPPNPCASDQSPVHNDSSDVVCSISEVKGNVGGMRHDFPTLHGVYIHGEVQGVKVAFTVDTGATSTLVSTKLYHRIP